MVVSRSHQLPVRAGVSHESTFHRPRPPRHLPGARPLPRGRHHADRGPMPQPARSGRSLRRLQRAADPIRAGVRRSVCGPPGHRTVFAYRCRLRHHRHRRRPAPWRLGGQFARLRRGRGLDARAGDDALAAAKHRPLRPGHPPGPMALQHGRTHPARHQPDRGRDGAGPDRQALRAHRPQHLRPGHRLRPAHHRRRLPGLRQAGALARRIVLAGRCGLDPLPAQRRDPRTGRRVPAAAHEARQLPGQHRARRDRRHPGSSRGAGPRPPRRRVPDPARSRRSGCCWCAATTI